MTQTTISALERALQRYSDDLYRLALLLTPDATTAVNALTGAARRMAEASADMIDEPALIAALIAALPVERPRWRPRRLPAWARSPATRADAAPILAAIARLPRRQRLALGMTMLRGYDPEQAAPLLGGDETHARTILRDALLALAPRAAPDLPLGDLDSAAAPADCQPTRIALSLGGAALHANPAVRGHLALCSACREAERTWVQLSTTVESALRGAIRDVRPPGDLTARLLAAIEPDQKANLHSRLSSPQARIAAVALVVLALVVALVLPRRAPEESAEGTTGAVLALAPRDLVQRAFEQLYASPAGNGVWHGHWEIRWNFADGAFAMLNADRWTDTQTGSHRIQLVHQDGGGPYEFELADGRGELWYAVASSYAPSLYPLIFDEVFSRVHLRLGPQDQQRMLQARLQSGAWDLAAAYLRQAQRAELRTWGRQRTADGTQIDLLSFRGTSPLAMPPDAPDATTSEVTIMLAIESTSGVLREVRELVGSEGGEQTGRVTWRFVGGEWLAGYENTSLALELSKAWNGTGRFLDRQSIADPALPLVEAASVKPLALGVLEEWTGLWMPSALPAGASRAMLVNLNNLPGTRIRDPYTADVALIYLAEGRRLVISTNQRPSQILSRTGGERFTLNGHDFALHAANGQSYRAAVLHERASFDDDTVITHIGAVGYTRAELLDVLTTLGRPTIDGYLAQARLFADPWPRDPQVFDTLLGAVAPTPRAPQDMIRYTVERTFKRHRPQPEQTTDPYHLPRYGGRPEELVMESWIRGLGSPAAEASMVIRDDGGKIYTRVYQGPATNWNYDAPTSWVWRYSENNLLLINQIEWGQSIALNLLACAKPRSEYLSNGVRVVAISESSWKNDSCVNPNYSNMYQTQVGGAIPWMEEEPYLADLQDTITTWLYLDADGRPTRAEIRSGATRAGLLIEAWELVSNAHLPSDQVSAEVFDPNPPETLFRRDALLQYNTALPEPWTVSITDAMELAQSRLFVLPPEAPAQLTTIEAAIGGEDISWFVDQRTPLDTAVRRGLALRFTYMITATDGVSPLMMRLYQGPADQLGDYLRAVTHWQASEPLQIDVAGRTIDGWKVVTWENGLSFHPGGGRRHAARAGDRDAAGAGHACAAAAAQPALKG